MRKGRVVHILVKPEWQSTATRPRVIEPRLGECAKNLESNRASSVSQPGKTAHAFLHLHVV